jgi:hypothetical protein
MQQPLPLSLLGKHFDTTQKKVGDRRNEQQEAQYAYEGATGAKCANIAQ